MTCLNSYFSHLKHSSIQFTMTLKLGFLNKLESSLIAYGAHTSLRDSIVWGLGIYIGLGKPEFESSLHNQHM